MVCGLGSVVRGSDVADYLFSRGPMTNDVAIAAIHAAEVIIPSGISAYAALAALRAAQNAADAKTAVDKVAHAMNSLLDKRVDEAKQLGTAEGTAAGVEQERHRTGQ